MQGQLQAQLAGQVLQVTHTVVHRLSVGALLCVQGPDHAVKGTPAAQALPRGDAAIIEFGLGAATPEQDGVVACEPFFIFQVGGDGGDLIGFAGDQ
ncbi:hypothetical protein D3C84_1136590 [compost metagenome]